MNITSSDYLKKDNSVSNHELHQQTFVDKTKVDPLYFKNSPKDLFYSKAMSLLQENLQQVLPKIGKEQLIKAISILSMTRKFQSRDKSLEIEFTLVQLFQHILNQKIPIEKIELVGSGVPFLLGSYIYDVLKNLDTENSNAWIPAELMEKFAKQPRDFDFRIHASKASIQDIQRLKECIVEFFSKNKHSLRIQILENGFTSYTNPKNLDESLMSVVGFHDGQQDIGIDLVLYERLDRESLFINDGLFLDLLPLCEALQNCSGEKLIEAIQADTSLPSITPRSLTKNQFEVLFDKIGGVIRADKPETINCAGWPNLLISYLKGNRCLSPDLETALLNKIINTLYGTKNVTDMPTPLRLELKHLPKEAPLSTKIAYVAAYWIKKSFESHLNNDPKLALPFILQTCISFYQNGHADSIDKLWQLLKPLIDAIEDPLTILIVKIMDSEPKAFKVLLSMLEVKAFHYLLANEKNVALVSHCNRPAFQFQLGKHVLLLPYNPSQAILNLNNLWKESKPSVQELLEQLDGLLQPKEHYVKKENIPCWSPIIQPIDIDYSKPWDRVLGEWQLASEVNQPSIHGQKLIFDYLISLSDIGKKRLIKSAELIGLSSTETNLYHLILQLMDKQGYSTLPLPLIWSMALASNGTSNSSLQAYSIWKLHSKSLPASINTQFTKLFLSKLSIGRPDLAAELLADFETNLPLKDQWICLQEIEKSIKKNVQFASLKTYLLLANSTAKLLHDWPHEKQKLATQDLEMVEWLLSNLMNYDKNVFIEAKSFCLEASKILPSESSVFNKMTESFRHFIVKEQTICNEFEAALKIMSFCRSPSAALWTKLFEDIRSKKQKELWSKAWSIFHSIDLSRFEGSHSEIANAWYTALKTMPTMYAPQLQVLLGKENQILKSFGESKLKLHFTTLLYSTLLDECEKNASEENLKKLLAFRESIITTFNIPYGYDSWQEKDCRLAKCLTTCSIPLIETALTIFYALNEQEESREAFNLLVRKNLTNDEIALIAKPLLKLPFRLKEDKHPLLVKILDTPNVNFLIKNGELEFLEVISSWIEQISRTKVNQKQLQHIFKFVLCFYLFQEDLQAPEEWEKVINDLFSKLDIESVRQDLKQILITSFYKLITIFEKNPDSKSRTNLINLYKNSIAPSSPNETMIDLFFNWMPSMIAKSERSTLLDLLNKFYDFDKQEKNEDNVVAKVLIAFDFFNQLELENLEKESLSALEFLLNKLKNPDLLNKVIPLLVTSKNVQSTGCFKLLEKLKTNTDHTIKLAIWEIFWKIYVEKDLLKPSLQLNEKWSDILEMLSEKLPEKLFVILSNIETFCKLIDDIDNTTHNSFLTESLLDKSALKLSCFKGEELKNKFRDWVSTEDKLKMCLPKFDFDKSAGLPKITAFFIAGDKTQYQWAINETNIFVKDLEDCDSLKLTLPWFLNILKVTPLERRNTSFTPILNKLLQKIHPVIPTSSAPIRELFEQFFNYLLIKGTPEEKFLILEFLCSTPADFMLNEKSCCLIQLLQTVPLDAEETKYYTNTLTEACKELIKLDKFSPELTGQFLKMPFIPLPPGNDSLYYPLFERIFKSLPLYKKDYLACLELAKEWVPYIIENDDNYSFLIAKSLEILSDLSSTDFELYCREFQSIKDRFSSYDHDDIWPLVSMRVLMDDLPYQTGAELLYASGLIQTEMMVFLSHDWPKENLQAKQLIIKDLLERYTITFLTHQDLSILNINENWYGEYQQRLREILTSCYHKDVFFEDFALYFHLACFAGDLQLSTSVMPKLNDLLQLTKETCFKEIFSNMYKNGFNQTSIAINILNTNGKHMSLQTVKFCWIEILKSSSDFDNIQTQHVVSSFMNSSFLANSNQSIEHQEVVVSVCSAMLKRFASGGYDISVKTGNYKIMLQHGGLTSLDCYGFVIQFLDSIKTKGVFKSNVNLYFGLVEFSLKHLRSDISKNAKLSDLEKILYPKASNDMENVNIHSCAKKVIVDLLKIEGLKQLEPYLIRLLHKKDSSS